MRSAILATVALAACATAHASLVGAFNSSMLRSELPPDSPLLAVRPLKASAYNAATAKSFVYFAGISYCAEADILDWYA